MLGAGFIADYHLDGLAAAGGAVVRTIASRSAENARRLARKHGIADATDDWRRALDRTDIDAVIIATPDPTHEEIAIAAAHAGKHVLLQKPMAGDVAACTRILSAARSAGVDLQVSFMHRHFAEVHEARRLLGEGAIGRVHSVRIRNATPGPDWGDWFFDASNPANGVVYQLGVHGIDLTTWLLAPIERVCANVSTQLPTRRLRDGRVVDVRVPDTALARYHYASGAVGSHEMSMIEVQGCDRFRLELYGDAGTLWLRSERGPLALWSSGKGAWWVPDLDAAPLGQRHHREWLDGIVGRSQRADTATEAIEGMRVIAAITRSSALDGRQVAVVDDAGEGRAR